MNVVISLTSQSRPCSLAECRQPHASDILASAARSKNMRGKCFPIVRGVQIACERGRRSRKSSGHLFSSTGQLPFYCRHPRPRSLRERGCSHCLLFYVCN